MALGHEHVEEVTLTPVAEEPEQAHATPRPFRRPGHRRISLNQRYEHLLQQHMSVKGGAVELSRSDAALAFNVPIHKDTRSARPHYALHAEETLQEPAMPEHSTLNSAPAEPHQWRQPSARPLLADIEFSEMRAAGKPPAPEDITAQLASVFDEDRPSRMSTIDTNAALFMGGDFAPAPGALVSFSLSETAPTADDEGHSLPAVATKNMASVRAFAFHGTPRAHTPM